jgi:hypothetical protein
LFEGPVNLPEPGRASNVPPRPGPDAIPGAPNLNVPATNFSAQPTPYRLSLPSQRVTLHNTDQQQTFTVRDRFLRPVVFLSGEQKEIELPLDEIKRLAYLACEDRGVYPAGVYNAGQPLPSHPLKLIGLPDIVQRDANGVPIDPEKASIQEAAERAAKLEKQQGDLASTVEKLSQQMAALMGVIAARETRETQGAQAPVAVSPTAGAGQAVGRK